MLADSRVSAHVVENGPRSAGEYPSARTSPRQCLALGIALRIVPGVAPGVALRIFPGMDPGTVSQLP